MILLTALGFALCLMVALVLAVTVNVVEEHYEMAIWVILFLTSVSVGLIMLLMTIEGVFK